MKPLWGPALALAVQLLPACSRRPEAGRILPADAGNEGLLPNATPAALSHGASDAREEAPKDASEEAPKDASEEAPKDASEEAPKDAQASALSPLRRGGGAPACSVLRGPIALSARGAVTLAARADAMLAVLDDNGTPRVARFSVDPVRAPPPAPAPESETRAGPALAVPCAVVSDGFFCPDREGDVHRYREDGGSPRVVASSRPGSRIAAGELPGRHDVLAYLASRQTAEGWVSEAWTALDDAPPVRASVDGSGATSLALEAKGRVLRLVLVDARAALTAMHVRNVAIADGALALGEDTVVFVAGPGDRRTGAVLAGVSDAPGWALMPIARDIGSFGLAIVRLDVPPRVDEPAAWSMYPNGLDPAPVAAVASHESIWVARVRPDSARVGSGRLLELGRMLPSGQLAPADAIPTTGDPTDVSLAVDPSGFVWLAWTDAGGSWVERLDCH